MDCHLTLIEKIIADGIGMDILDKDREPDLIPKRWSSNYKGIDDLLLSFIERRRITDSIFGSKGDCVWRRTQPPFLPYEWRNLTMEELKIFFSDLNEETQQRVLKFYGIADPKQGNFDSDIVPLFILECPEEGM